MMEWWNGGRLERQWNLTIRQFDNSTMEEWKNGMMEEWKSGMMERQRNGTIRQFDPR